MKDIANTPLVSIICSTYNHGLYISQCLDGFLMQKTNFPFEILIHDDASTDNTPDIIREYEHNHPQVIRPIYQKETNIQRKKISLPNTNAHESEESILQYAKETIIGLTH